MTTMRELFWVLALGIIACFAFFLALGAISLGDALVLTIVVAILTVMWIAHAMLGGRHAVVHDDRLTHARERRGF